MLAGASRIDITPPKGVPMGGYLARAEPAEDVHEPLYARALVLDDGQVRGVVVSADLPTIEPAAALEIRQRIESRRDDLSEIHGRLLVRRHA
jgi:neutral ceramidase